jgi:predicted DNA-binding ribbon-helix-helix protein
MIFAIKPPLLAFIIAVKYKLVKFKSGSKGVLHGYISSRHRYPCQSDKIFEFDNLAKFKYDLLVQPVDSGITKVPEEHFMCQIYASTEPTRYDSEARSLRIQGSVTSIRLEKEFWSILEEMAKEAESSTPELINTLYTEVHQNFGEVRNFTSFLRTACTIFLSRKESYSPSSEQLAEQVHATG